MHGKTPPTALQTEYILASRKATTLTQRTWRTALSVGLIVALSLAALAFVQRQQAIQERQQAVYERDVAISGNLISQSQILGDTNPALSKLLSIAAWRLSPSSDARYAMLAAAARPGVARLTGQTGSVTSVAFSPDGKTLASGSTDDTIRLWNMATHQPIGQPLKGHTGSVTSVAFSPDGKTLASGSFDHTLRLWDVATRRPIGQPFSGQSALVASVAFSPDGKTLASGGADGTVRLWDVATHQPIGQPLKGHTGSVTSVAFSPDGKTLASGSFDHTIRLWC